MILQNASLKMMLRFTPRLSSSCFVVSALADVNFHGRHELPLSVFPTLLYPGDKKR